MEDRGSGYPPEVHEIILVPSMGSLSDHQPIYVNIYIYKYKDLFTPCKKMLIHLRIYYLFSCFFCSINVYVYIDLHKIYLYMYIFIYVYIYIYIYIY